LEPSEKYLEPSVSDYKYMTIITACTDRDFLRDHQYMN